MTIVKTIKICFIIPYCFYLSSVGLTLWTLIISSPEFNAWGGKVNGYTKAGASLLLILSIIHITCFSYSIYKADKN